MILPLKNDQIPACKIKDQNIRQYGCSIASQPDGKTGNDVPGQKINTQSAQLIFSGHNTNLLSAQLLRRDQIWITGKNSLLSPLSRNLLYK